MKQKEISASEFKAKCLRLLEELGPEGLIVTKRGRPIARVLPAKVADNRRFIGSMREEIQVHGDLFSTGLAWDAQSRHPHRRRRSQR